MTESLVSQFWNWMGWVFALNTNAFQAIASYPKGVLLAIAVVLLAGLSQAIAQSIILFINKVKPIRFVFSLLINAVLFVSGFLFLVLSTWLITLLPWSVHVTFPRLLIVLGISYAPLLFSVLGALPYLGVPILWLLSIWHLLAIVVGVGAIAEVGLGNAFGYVAIGWLILQILQNTLGRPIANIGRWLADTVAGVELATNRQEVVEIVSNRVNEASISWQAEMQERLASARHTASTMLGGAPDVTDAPSAVSPSGAVAIADTPKSSFVSGAERGLSRTIKTVVGLLGMALLTFLVIVLLRPIREWLFGWYTQLPVLLRFVFDLVWIGIIAVVVAGLLAPLETLGWWAGWYDDEVDTTLNAGELAQPIAEPSQISRYLVYLDGIGKSTFEYLPDIEEFLNTLTPTLPKDVALVRGIMPYSVLNNPLDEDRPLAFLWKLADRFRFANPASVLGLLVNIRNVFVVGVSADKRYGPLYNQGIAQLVYNGLLKNGYPTNSGIPITLIGYSGGGQMACASAPFLKRALSAPVDVISLGGVISGNCNILKLEHLYHLVGDQDTVEQIGPIMFPGRWKLFPLSYWNRAKRRGKISIYSLGPVGHQVPGGILDPNVILPNGRSALQYTIDYINAILQDKLCPSIDLSTVKTSHYSLYQTADFNRPGYYPLDQTVDPTLYQPIAPWMGRLILPKREERSLVRGVWFEVHHADASYSHLVGQVVKLRWVNDPKVKNRVAAVTQDVHFSAEAEYTSRYAGLVHPTRLNHWQRVGPLESLAGSLPHNDLVVMLDGEVSVDESAPNETIPGRSPVILYIRSGPVQITGRYYALVKFIQPIADTDQFRVIHFNRASRQFDGVEALVRMPQVLMADAYGSYPSTSHKIEQSPLNETGWYIYGANDADGLFVVRSLAPRSLLKLQPNRVVFGKKAAYHYIRKETWDNVKAQKGQVSSVLCAHQNHESSAAIQHAIDEWQEGTRALVLHTYGGIGGKRREPAAATPIFFGHFAYGMAEVVRDPLADELRFDIRYYQVYTHNTDGLIAGTLHWSRYLGDRQLGWLGTRPICDIVVKLDAFTEPFDGNGIQRSALNLMITYLQVMTARYRIGDGTGGTYVGPANNCSQDSNQALFASIQQMQKQVNETSDLLEQWAKREPEQAKRFQHLIQLGKDLKRQLQLFGQPRTDWEKNEFNLGSSLEDEPLKNLIIGLGSWRTLLPRKASDTVIKVFLDHDASAWVLRTNQVGGHDPDIEPIAPMTL